MLATLAGGKFIRALLLALAGALCGFVGYADQPSVERAWSARDSVAVRYVVTNADFPGTLDDGRGNEVIEWAADRKHFFFIARHGDLSCDCNRYQLSIYAAQDLKRRMDDSSTGSSDAAQPLRSIEFSSSRSDPWYQGIIRPHWENNGAILFMGVRNNEPRQVYRLQLASGVLSQLTHGPHDVLSYAAQDDSIVYAITRKSPNTDLDDYPAVAVDADEMLQLTGTDKYRTELFASFQGGAARPIAKVFAVLAGPWIDPQGRRALVVLAPEDMKSPPSWEGYEVKPSKYFNSMGRFMLVDLEQGTIQPVLDAPTGKATRLGWQSTPQVLWSADGLNAVLVNTALPLEEAAEDRKNTPYIVELNATTGRWSVIDKLFRPRAGQSAQTIIRVDAIDWTRPGAAFRMTATVWEGTNPPFTVNSVYARAAKRWTHTTTSQPFKVPHGGRHGSSELNVTVRQSANEPQIPVVSYRGKTLALLEPDPALSGIWRAPVRQVEWREKDGRTISGGLMLPRVVATDHPPPLVIQAYHYQPDLFRPDGPHPTAYAAQPLVSAGIAVLAVDIPVGDKDLQWQQHVVGTVREGQAFVERIDAAVAALSKDGLIDPSRVGLIGFSRGGFMTYYAITHPGSAVLSAAVVADAYTGSYGGYVADAATSTNWNPDDGEAERYYGGGTFWQNKAVWLEQAPSFNIDKVTAAALFMTHGKATNLFSLETLGAFRINRRPFEYWSFGEGSHQLHRPKERLASLEGSVDWMKFWLLQQESDDLNKRPQYERWRKIRSDWDKLRAAEESAGPVSPNARSNTE